MLPIVLISLAYTVGIIWGLYLNFYLGIVFFCLFVCAYFVFNFILKKKNNPIIFVLIAFIIFGYVYSTYRSSLFHDIFKNENKIINEFTVISDVNKKEYYDIYKIKDSNNRIFILKLLKNNIVYEYGTKLKVKGDFEKPSHARNTGGFDYANYLYSQNIYGTIISNKVEIIDFPKINVIRNIQLKVKNVFLSLLPKNEAGIISGMVIGDTEDVSDETLDGFKKSGVTHLLAVSGSNVAYLIMAIKFILDKTIGKQYSKIGTILFVILFIFISGSSPSVIRAGIMACMIIISEIISRKSNLYANISFSALLILIYNPFYICDVGFILSFGGTIGIVLLSKKIEEKLGKYLHSKILLETLSVTISAQLILLPTMIYYFNEISLVSIVTNLIIVPITGIVTIFGMLITVIGFINLQIAEMFSYIVYTIIFFIMQVTQTFANIPFSTMVVPTIYIHEIIIYYIGIWCSVSRNYYKKYVIKVLIIVIFITISILIIPNNYLTVNMIDVGQGDAMYIETPHKKVILIDGGGSENSDYDIGEKVLLPYFYDKRKFKIDLIIISHMHDDHIEGVITVCENLKVDTIIIGPGGEETNGYKKLMEIVEKKNIKVIKIFAGEEIVLDGINIKILFPQDKQSDNLNNVSIVSKISYGNISMLTTGDIEKEAEDSINGYIKADILKVAHHGSKTSSTEEFLYKVKPQISLISVGKNNFGHPNKNVLENLKKYGDVFITKESGEIMLKIYKNGKIKINTCIK